MTESTEAAQASYPYERAKHLELLQKVAERMALNSRFCKLSSLVAAVAALALITPLSFSAVAVAVFVIACWGMDAMYLTWERRFREKYNDMRGFTWVKQPDFDIFPDIKAIQKCGLMVSFQSWSCLVYHGALLVLLAAWMVDGLMA